MGDEFQRGMLLAAMSLTVSVSPSFAVQVASFAPATPYRVQFEAPGPTLVCDEEQGGTDDDNVASPRQDEPDEPEPQSFVLPNTGDEPRLLWVRCHNQPDTAGPAVKAEVTRAVGTAIGDGKDFCGFLPVGVQIDCLADRFRRIARDLPQAGDYAPVREALRSGARKLAAIAEANAVPQTPRKRYALQRSDGKPAQQTSALSEVAPERIEAASQAALQVIEETKTILLRSAQNSQARMLHYQEIASAIDSTKVLLRST